MFTKNTPGNFHTMAKDKKGKLSNYLDILPSGKIKGLLLLIFLIY
ncbi:hypothetical protein [Okeania sp. SIO3B5]|nr:hypothetical protein [Okeania sp. SIO3B5]